jgi:hypothetical protein
MPNPISKSGLRPQLSALRPTRRAIGSMMICAAMMQDDIIAVAHSPCASASFCPTSGNSGAFAKWNSMAQPA